VAVRWFSMSTQFLGDPKVEQLGERHGPAGPLVIVALLGRAKVAGSNGSVTCSFRTLAHEAFTDRQKIPAILEAAAETGLIEVESLDVSGASVRFPAFNRWQDAGRKAEERAAREPTPRANVRTCPDLSGDVPTRQDKTEKRREEKLKATSGKPSEFDSWLEHYRQITGRATVTGSKSARQAFKARRKEGRSLDDLKAATVGCHSDEFCRTRGHDVPETILRASKVERYIALSVEPPKSGSAGVDRANEFAERAKSLRAKEAV
jgi:hypothetical protein